MDEWTGKLHDALAYAYVRGWYAGLDGAKTDEGKVEVARELATKLSAPARVSASDSQAVMAAEVVRLREAVRELHEALSFIAGKVADRRSVDSSDLARAGTAMAKAREAL